MNLFTEQINNWNDWGNVFQSISAFTPLIKRIFENENLPFQKIDNLKPGTNAVFKVGEYVIKIFAPIEAGGDSGGAYGTDVDVELFGMRLANARDVPSPKLIADGVLPDKYKFRYIIMEHIRGNMLGDIEDRLTYEEKFIIGQNVRKITDMLNAPPCEKFTSIDVVKYALENDQWMEEGFPESFLAERADYLINLNITENDKVYCHGDLHCDNILIDDKLNVYIVDFADAMYAPAEYELLYIVSALFCFEKPYMAGYFGEEYSIEDIVNLCIAWLPVHAWGHSTIRGNLGSTEAITSFSILREQLCDLIEREKKK